METTKFSSKTQINRKWYVVDAEGQILGRLATKVASYLRGKHKPIFTPNVDTGDFIIVVNADKVRLTGNKLNNKVYYSHSGYPGGLKAETAKNRLSRKPELMVQDAVWGMLPKNRLGKAMLKKLKVYKGAEHPHKAQMPEALK